MDARYANTADIKIGELPVIERARPSAPSSWVPSRLLHGLIGLGWVAWLWTIGLFSIPPEGTDPVPPSGVFEQFMLIVVLGAIVGVLGVIGAAIVNSPKTARYSLLAGSALALLGASCGLEGHPISEWGPGAGTAAALGVAGLAIMGRQHSSVS